MDTTDGATCWQCGAPARPDCTYVEKLSRPKRAGLDGQGFRVTQGWASNTVHVPVPRCGRCRARDAITAVIAGLALLLGAAVGAAAIPLRGVSLFLGGAAGFMLVFMLRALYWRLAGLRDMRSYPPLRRLREAGWVDLV